MRDRHPILHPFLLGGDLLPVEHQQLTLMLAAQRLQPRSRSAPTGPGEPRLAEVRHGTVEKSPNPFRISSGRHRVCTTFGERFESFRKAQTELVKKRFLFRIGFGDAA